MIKKKTAGAVQKEKNILKHHSFLFPKIEKISKLENKNIVFLSVWQFFILSCFAEVVALKQKMCLFYDTFAGFLLNYPSRHRRCLKGILTNALSLVDKNPILSSNTVTFFISEPDQDGPERNFPEKCS